ncbi:unnamed protein product [Vitrella brassicaformis CCMP3155]|uniref:Uncharacterized protein n=2 Tax=Vitrella brassicaformis TaxID=1169539 RepID=A0A0G4F5N7_VITBC|nr:unnamed protein product [Vitrella brassicaformis CCMP3155]|eukprot:CEM07675.1 unnamed protein product [Vitrella brassicaformis CCMP3155]
MQQAAYGYPNAQPYSTQQQQYQQQPQGAAQPLSNPFGGGAGAPVLSSPFGTRQQQPQAPQAPSQPTQQPPGGGFGQPPMGKGIPPPPTSAQMAAGGYGAPPAGAAPPPTTAHAPTSFKHGGTRPGYYPQAAAGAVSQTGAGGYPEYPGVGGQMPGMPGMPGQAVSPTHDAQAEAIAKECAEFNAPPTFVRPSLTKFPNSQNMKQKAKIPLGVLFQPLARKYRVPAVNFGSVGTVVRCKRCRTYINPFVQWEANGRRWVCNLCGYINDTPNHYYYNLDETGKRADRYERCELSTGSVEYIAPGEYMVRPPQPPVFMFVIDVTLPAVNNGLVDTVVHAIRTALQSEKLPGGSRTQIGIMTFDSSIHFYNLNGGLAQPQMLVVSDLEDLFLPLPDDILVNASESEKVVQGLLDSLPSMHRNTKINESCLGSAVKAAHMAVKHIGGKVLVFASTLPTVGELQLKYNRYKPPMLNTEREVELLKPADEEYKALAVELTRVQISVELFLCPNQYIDAASLAPLVKFTGGDLHYYSNFNASQQGDKLREELLHVLTRNMGWEAVMRIRVSRGWKITNFFGHLYIRGMDLLVVPNCHSDQTFSICLDLEENVIPEPIVCVQCALLYTNSDGERRIRVHTYSMPVTQSFPEMMNSMDAQAAASLLSQQAVDQALKAKLADARTFLQSSCSQIVASAGTGTQGGEPLRLLPLYVMGMLKSIAFRATNDVHPDQRVFSWLRLESLPVDMQASFFYPRMVALHNLDHTAGTVDEQDQVQLPAPMNLTSEGMSQDGAFLMEDGEMMMMWIGRSISLNFLYSVFGVSSLDQLNPDVAETLIGTTGDQLSSRVNAIIQAIRLEREPPYMKLYIIRQGEPAENRFFSNLVEDRTLGLQLTYNEFLSKLGSRPMGAAAAAAPTATAGPMRQY